mgnify:CR=1 FL=1
MLKRLIRWLTNSAGLELTRIRANWRGMPFPDGFMRELLREQGQGTIALLRKVEPFTMTSPERVAALVEATRYVSRACVPGAIVECGVWRGGSMMAIALSLLELGDTTRDLFLFDTYEGMSASLDKDKDCSGNLAAQLLANTPAGTDIWCEAGIEEVRANLLMTGYPAERLHFIKGKVEDTLPHAGLGRIALLRLDTDWYESTRHELVLLYPQLVVGGVLIIDDYGHWQGAREAVDEYFANPARQPVLLQRVDYSGRLVIKCSDAG